MDDHIVHIKNQEHFIVLSLDFDKKYNTRTMLTHMTIKEIAENYSHWNTNTINAEWERNVAAAFGKNNIRYSNEMDISEFTHFNNIVTFRNSFKQFGLRVLNPIHIHYSANYSAAHPGNKRIRLLYDVYKEKIPVIITDYSKTHPKLGFDKFNFSGQKLYYNFSKNHFLKNKFNCEMIKEVLPTDNEFEDNSFSKANRLKTVRTFEYKNNKVYCDNYCILSKENGLWKTNLIKQN